MRARLLGRVILALLVTCACGRFRRMDMRELEKAGMSYSHVQELRQLETTEAEVAELVKVRQSGVSEAGCVELVHIARGRAAESARAFTAGEAVAGLKNVGLQDNAILELAKLNQLGAWAFEARAIRLAGISDEVIMALARQRAAGRPILSGPVLARLKNVGYSDQAILELVRDGTSDEDAEAIVTQRQRAAGGTTFRRRR